MHFFILTKKHVDYLRSVLLEKMSLSTILDRQYLQLIIKILHIFFLIFSILVVWYCARFGEYLTTHFFMQTSNLLFLLYKFFLRSALCGAHIPTTADFVLNISMIRY